MWQGSASDVWGAETLSTNKVHKCIQIRLVFWVLNILLSGPAVGALLGLCLGLLVFASSAKAGWFCWQISHFDSLLVHQAAAAASVTRRQLSSFSTKENSRKLQPLSCRQNEASPGCSIGDKDESKLCDPSTMPRKSQTALPYQIWRGPEWLAEKSMDIPWTWNSRTGPSWYYFRRSLWPASQRSIESDRHLPAAQREVTKQIDQRKKGTKRACDCDLKCGFSFCPMAKRLKNLVFFVGKIGTLTRSRLSFEVVFQ